MLWLIVTELSRSLLSIFYPLPPVVHLISIRKTKRTLEIVEVQAVKKEAQEAMKDAQLHTDVAEGLGKSIRISIGRQRAEEKQLQEKVGALKRKRQEQEEQNKTNPQDEEPPAPKKSKKEEPLGSAEKLRNTAQEVQDRINAGMGVEEIEACLTQYNETQAARKPPPPPMKKKGYTFGLLDDEAEAEEGRATFSTMDAQGGKTELSSDEEQDPTKQLAKALVEQKGEQDTSANKQVALLRLQRQIPEAARTERKEYNRIRKRIRSYTLAHSRSIIENNIYKAITALELMEVIKPTEALVARDRLSHSIFITDQDDKTYPRLSAAKRQYIVRNTSVALLEGAIGRGKG